MKPEFVIPYIDGSRDYGYTEVHFSNSVDSPYIPISALTTGDLVKKGDNKVLFYSLKVPTVPLRDHYTYERVKKFGDFAMKFVEPNRYGYWHILDHASISLDYLINYGMLIHMREGLYPQPLMLLCAKRSELFQIKKDKPDWRQFALVVNRELMRNEEHQKIYRNLKAAFEPLEEEAKIDVVFTDHIEDLCFRNTLVQMPKFKTLPDMFQHLKAINGEIISTLKASFRLS
jgi:hypothetical protein